MFVTVVFFDVIKNACSAPKKNLSSIEHDIEL